MACPLPENVSKCLAQPVYSIGGSDYIALELCDNNGKLLAVYELCSGVLSGAPTYYTLAGAAYTPVGTPRNCDAAGDFEQFVFCDNITDPPTPFISRVLWDSNLDLIPDKTGTFALDGITPYTPLGTISVCGGDVVDAEMVGPICEKDATGVTVGKAWHKIFYRGQTQIATALVGYKLAAPGTWIDPYVVGAGNTLAICDDSSTAQIIDDCGDAGRNVIAYGENLLTNGNFEDSTGAGATSSNGPGWTTGYTPTANIYATGAGSYAFFTTNAGAVTNAASAGVLAIGSRSIAVNVGPNTALPILAWTNIYLENGQTYALLLDTAMFGAPYGIGVYVDGVLQVPITPPVAANTWERTKTTFTWTGVTGNHTVSINSNNAAGAGNDHAFDNIELRTAFPANTEVRTPESYSDTVRAIVDQIVETTGCNDDRRDELLAQIAKAIANAKTPEIEILCKCDDVNADGVGEVSYKEIVSIAPDGTVTSLAIFNQGMTAAYTPVNPVSCEVPGDNLTAAKPRYKVLTNAATWVLGADSALPTSSVAVSVIAVGNIATPPTVTDAGGTYPLFAGQSVAWATQFQRDVSGLRPPLTFTCTAGSVIAVSWLEEVI